LYTTLHARQLSGLQNNIRFLQSDVLQSSDPLVRADLQDKISKLTEKYNDILMNPNHAIGGIIDPQGEGQSPGSEDGTGNGQSPSFSGSDEFSPSESETTGSFSSRNNGAGGSQGGSENGSSGNGQSGSGSSNGSSSNDGSGGEDELQDFPSSTMVTSTPPSELL
jgi:hypothetical protein